MKFVITETKREQVVDKFLTKKYGGLIPLEERNLDLIFFLKDTGREPNQNDIVFHHNPVTYTSIIPWEMVTDLEVFGYGLLASRRIVKDWLKKTYNIESIELFRKI
jgi:hypothetical protein